MVARLLEIAQKLEGLYRHASTHAAGMVIGDRPLDELVPLYRDPKSNFPVTQFNWKLVEAAGLVKFDFLGLKTLTVLQKAVELIKRGRGIDVDLPALPLDDQKSLRAARQGRHGRRVPAGMHGHARELEAAEARPLRGHHRHGGALPPRPDGQHPDLHQPQARRGAGRLPASACSKPILKETYGVIIYQEQVMQIAQVMAGYSLGEADLLRRAMGKKDKAEMAQAAGAASSRAR